MTALSFAHALLPGGWAEGVTIEVGADGTIASVTAGAVGGRGIALPGVPNCHSHAFQRAMAGLTERAGPTGDSFWTWRELMYHFAQTIGPDELGAIAAQLYVEMLKGGYTSVAEFHYLHHAPGGTSYATTTELSDRVIGAARHVGIAITHLPVLYAYAGFGAQPPQDDQARFNNSAVSFLRIVSNLRDRYAGDTSVRVGIAPHSLRATSEPMLRDVLTGLNALDDSAPVHIHIAEQVKEVDDCIAWSCARPVAWLMDHFDVSERWCLIHATHMDASETKRLAASGAVAGVCPTTEANLGDGLFPARDYLNEGGKIAIGSDSNVTLSAAEELRLFEYGQRLVTRERNVLAGAPGASTGRRLLDAVTSGGAQALGLSAGSLEVGKRADIVVLDAEHPALAHRAGDDILDSWIFMNAGNPVRDVYVAGRKVIEDGYHAQQDEIASRFRLALKQLG